MEELTAPASRLPLSTLRECDQLYSTIAQDASFSAETDALLKSLLRKTCRSGVSAYDEKGLPRLIMALETADAFAHFIDKDPNILLTILLCDFYGEAISPRKWKRNAEPTWRG